jgi:two-component system, response regulator YesN
VILVRRRKQEKQFAILWKFLVVYFVLLFIPLLIAGLLYQFQIGEIEANIRDTNFANLALNKDVVEAATRDITTTIAAIRSESRLNELLQLKGPLNPQLMLKIGRSHLESLLVSADNPYLVDIVVYLKDIETILTTRDVFFSTSLFYRSFFSEADTPYDDWHAELSYPQYVRRSPTFKRISYYGESYDVIELQEPLPVTPRLLSRGTLIAYVNRDAVESLMRKRLLHGEGYAYIEMDDGRRFAEVSSQDEGIIPQFALPDEPSGIMFLDHENSTYAVTYIRSDYNNWLYVAAVPKSVFLEQSERIESIFLLLAILVVAIGIPVAVVAAYRFSKPLMHVSEILKDGVLLLDAQNKGGLQFISESVSELLRRNSSLKDMLEEQKPYVKQVVIDRLFRGDFVSQEEIHAFLDHFEVDIRGSFYGVACVYIDGYYDEVDAEILKEFIVKNTLIRKQLTDVLADRALVHEISLNRIGVVLVLEHSSGDETLDDYFTNRIRDMNAHLASFRDVQCHVAEGGIVQTLLDVPDALETANRRLNESSFEIGANGANGSNGHNGHNGNGAHELYYYPPELELRIITLTTNGRVDELTDVTDTIRLENFENRTLTVRMMKTFAKEIEGTRLKINNRMARAPIPVAQSTQAAHPTYRVGQLSLRDEIESQLTGFVDLAIEIATRGNHTHRFKKPIADYISEHYMDNEMSLKRLALEFKLSEVYLSKLWRELFGTNFFAYIEDLRMNQACKLLQSGKMTIDQVALTIGYNSAHAFRRAFKRSIGVSPSNYR